MSVISTWVFYSQSMQCQCLTNARSAWRISLVPSNQGMYQILYLISLCPMATINQALLGKLNHRSNLLTLIFSRIKWLKHDKWKRTIILSSCERFLLLLSESRKSTKYWWKHWNNPISSMGCKPRNENTTTGNLQ